MSLAIYDTNDVPQSAFNLGLAEQADNPMQIRVDCQAGFQLKAENVAAGVTVSGRFLGDPTYQNIATSPLILTPYAGQRKTVEIKIATPDISVVTEGEFRFSLQSI
jgi:hypothetical protein